MEENREQQQYDVVVKVVGTVSRGYASSMKQWGVIADASGVIRFTSWNTFSGPNIEVNTWYQMHNVRYRFNNATPNLLLDAHTSVVKLPSAENVEPLSPIEFDYHLPYKIVRVMGVCQDISTYVYPNVKQKGWIGNAENFKMPFTMFSSGGQTPLEEEKIYDIQYASVENFQHRRELYVDCANITEITSEEYPIDQINLFFEIDPPVINAQTKRIYPQIFSTAQSVYSFPPAIIQDRIRVPLTEARINYEQMAMMDYASPENQLAYMFGYFPFYIEPIRAVLNSIPQSQLDRIFTQGLKVNFYGCGPAPELLGFIRYVSEKYPAITHIQATFIDGNCWSPWRTCVINDICPEYWSGHVNPTDVVSDILELPTSNPALIADADIHCIQNVCSDLIKRVDYERVSCWLSSVYHLSKMNSLMAVIDVHYSPIRTRLFEPTIEKIRQYHDQATIFTVPSFCQTNLDFVPPPRISLPTNRRSNGYRYLVVIKNRGELNAL
jgi:hypothetical protein